MTQGGLRQDWAIMTAYHSHQPHTSTRGNPVEDAFSKWLVRAPTRDANDENAFTHTLSPFAPS